MLKKVIVVLSVFLSFIYPQVWIARYNGEVNLDDCAVALAVDEQENVYVTGYSYGLTNKKGYLTIKYNSNGETLWTRRYEGIGNSEPKSLEIDNEGNVYVTGWGESENNYRDILTIKYNPSGEILWTRRYNGPSNQNDEPTKMAIDLRSNVYITGFSYNWGTGYDYVTIKYDREGNERWVRRYNGPGDSTDKSNSVAVDREGNVYITGTSYGLGTKGDFATIRYDSLGNIIWVKRYDDTLNWLDDEAIGIGRDTLNNIYVAGLTSSEWVSPFLTFTVIKYNSAGEEQWVVQSIPGAGNDSLSAMTVDYNGNVYVSGSEVWWMIGRNYKTERYDSSGRRLWVAGYDADTSHDVSYGIAIDSSRNVYVTGMSRSDYATIKYNPSGAQLWVARYNGPGNDRDEAYAIALDNVGNVYVTGRSKGVNSGYDYCTIKYLPFGPVFEEYKKRMRGDNLPGIISPKRLTLIPETEIYNCHGRLIRRKEVSSGIYFILRREKMESINKKLVIIK